MIYAFTIILGLVASVLSFISGVTEGNITHLENDREPNTGYSIFPTIPVFPLVGMAIAWILERVFLQNALGILLGAFVILVLFWSWSFANVYKKYRTLLNQANLNNLP